VEAVVTAADWKGAFCAIEAAERHAFARYRLVASLPGTAAVVASLRKHAGDIDAADIARITTFISKASGDNDSIVLREPDRSDSRAHFLPRDCVTLVFAQAESPEGARKVFTKWAHWKLSWLSQ
jgi:hypothetical protein